MGARQPPRGRRRPRPSKRGHGRSSGTHAAEPAPRRRCTAAAPPPRHTLCPHVGGGRHGSGTGAHTTRAYYATRVGAIPSYGGVGRGIHSEEGGGGMSLVALLLTRRGGLRRSKAAWRRGWSRCGATGAKGARGWAARAGNDGSCAAAPAPRRAVWTDPLLRVLALAAPLLARVERGAARGAGARVSPGPSAARERERRARLASLARALRSG